MGTYDSLIQNPVDVGRFDVEQYGAPVRAAIIDLDSRVSQLKALGLVAPPISTSTNGTPTPSNGAETPDDVLGPYIFEAVTGTIYRVTYSGAEMNASVANDRFAFNIRFCEGVPPDASNTRIAASSHVCPATLSAGRETVQVSGVFTTDTGTMYVSVFMVRLNGSGVGTPTGLRELYVEAIGYV